MDPTRSTSFHGEPVRSIVIEISTTFFPAALLPGAEGREPDVILYTCDSVFFYCHSSILLNKSSNSFGNLLQNIAALESGPTTGTGSGSSSGPSSFLGSAPVSTHTSGSSGSTESRHHSSSPMTPSPLPTYAIAERGPVINVVLHIVYNMSFRRFAPDLATIRDSVYALDKYGITTPPPTAEIWTFVLKHSQHGGLASIGAYALAASLNMEALCVQISPYTLDVSLTDSITEADALIMGPVYLRRLFFLHLGRRDALKRVITSPPATHRALPGCSLDDQTVVSKAWELAVADLLLTTAPQNTSKEELENVLGVVVRRRGACGACYETVKVRVSEVVAQWQAVKNTI